MPLKANKACTLWNPTQDAECISHRLNGRLCMSLVLQLPHKSGLASNPCPLCNDVSHLPLVQNPQLPGSQLSSFSHGWKAWPDSLQYKGMACAFPFFRCLNLEYCQDPYRGQQEIQNMPEGMGTNAAGSKRVHNNRVPQDPAVQTFSEE